MFFRLALDSLDSCLGLQVAKTTGMFCHSALWFTVKVVVTPPPIHDLGFSCCLFIYYFPRQGFSL